MALFANAPSPLITNYPAPPVVTPPASVSLARQMRDMRGPMLQTANLRIRRWESRDVRPFVKLCADPEIMQFFNGPLSPIQCFQEMERQEVCFETFQYGMWAVELKETGEFIGCVGLDPTMMALKGMTARLTWKLRRDFWGMNYAYEAATEVMDYAFTQLEVSEVIAPVHPANIRSRRLVKRLGLLPQANDPDCYYKIVP